jgi:hypothetical protein
MRVLIVMSGHPVNGLSDGRRPINDERKAGLLLRPREYFLDDHSISPEIVSAPEIM